MRTLPHTHEIYETILLCRRIYVSFRWRLFWKLKFADFPVQRVLTVTDHYVDWFPRYTCREVCCNITRYESFLCASVCMQCGRTQKCSIYWPLIRQGVWVSCCDNVFCVLCMMIGGPSRLTSTYLPRFRWFAAKALCLIALTRWHRGSDNSTKVLPIVRGTGITLINYDCTSNNQCWSLELNNTYLISTQFPTMWCIIKYFPSM